MHFIPISGQGGVNRQYYEYDGKEYYYVEPATNLNLWIGQVPSIYNPQDFMVVPLVPIPLVSHSLPIELRVGRVVRIQIRVKNMGAISVEDIKTPIYKLSNQGF